MRLDSFTTSFVLQGLYAFSKTALGKRGSPGGEQPPPDASVPYYPCGMKQPDEFSEYYADLLEGRYDCVDRIVLTGYFPLGQQGSGFRYWWRKLTEGNTKIRAQSPQDRRSHIILTSARVRHNAGHSTSIACDSRGCSRHPLTRVSAAAVSSGLRGRRSDR
jgi:hypothetical protein